MTDKVVFVKLRGNKDFFRGFESKEKGTFLGGVRKLPYRNPSYLT